MAGESSSREGSRTPTRASPSAGASLYEDLVQSSTPFPLAMLRDWLSEHHLPAEWLHEFKTANIKSLDELRSLSPEKLCAILADANRQEKEKVSAKDSKKWKATALKYGKLFRAAQKKAEDAQQKLDAAGGKQVDEESAKKVEGERRRDKKEIVHLRSQILSLQRQLREASGKAPVVAPERKTRKHPMLCAMLPSRYPGWTPEVGRPLEWWQRAPPHSAPPPAHPFAVHSEFLASHHGSHSSSSSSNRTVPAPAYRRPPPARTPLPQHSMSLPPSTSSRAVSLYPNEIGLGGLMPPQSHSPLAPAAPLPQGSTSSSSHNSQSAAVHQSSSSSKSASSSSSSSWQRLPTDAPQPPKLSIVIPPRPKASTAAPAPPSFVRPQFSKVLQQKPNGPTPVELVATSSSLSSSSSHKAPETRAAACHADASGLAPAMSGVTPVASGRDSESNSNRPVEVGDVQPRANDEVIPFLGSRKSSLKRKSPEPVIAEKHGDNSISEAPADKKRRMSPVPVRSDEPGAVGENACDSGTVGNISQSSSSRKSPASTPNKPKSRDRVERRSRSGSKRTRSSHSVDRNSNPPLPPPPPSSSSLSANASSSSKRRRSSKDRSTSASSRRKGDRSTSRPEHDGRGSPTAVDRASRHENSRTEETQKSSRKRRKMSPPSVGVENDKSLEDGELEEGEVEPVPSSDAHVGTSTHRSRSGGGTGSSSSHPRSRRREPPTSSSSASSSSKKKKRHSKTPSDEGGRRRVKRKTANQSSPASLSPRRVADSAPPPPGEEKGFAADNTRRGGSPSDERDAAAATATHHPLVRRTSIGPRLLRHPSTLDASSPSKSLSRSPDSFTNKRTSMRAAAGGNSRHSDGSVASSGGESDRGAPAAAGKTSKDPAVKSLFGNFSSGGAPAGNCDTAAAPSVAAGSSAASLQRSNSGQTRSASRTEPEMSSPDVRPRTKASLPPAPAPTPPRERSPSPYGVGRSLSLSLSPFREDLPEDFPREHALSDTEMPDVDPAGPTFPGKSKPLPGALSPPKRVQHNHKGDGKLCRSSDSPKATRRKRSRSPPVRRPRPSDSHSGVAIASSRRVVPAAAGGVRPTHSHRGGYNSTNSVASKSSSSRLPSNPDRHPERDSSHKNNPPPSSSSHEHGRRPSESSRRRDDPRASRENEHTSRSRGRRSSKRRDVSPDGYTHKGIVPSSKQPRGTQISAGPARGTDGEPHKKPKAKPIGHLQHPPQSSAPSSSSSSLQSNSSSSRRTAAASNRSAHLTLHHHKSKTSATSSSVSKKSSREVADTPSRPSPAAPELRPPVVGGNGKAPFARPSQAAAAGGGKGKGYVPHAQNGGGKGSSDVARRPSNHDRAPKRPRPPQNGRPSVSKYAHLSIDEILRQMTGKEWDTERLVRAENGRLPAAPAPRAFTPRGRFAKPPKGAQKPQRGSGGSGGAQSVRPTHGGPSRPSRR